MCGIWIKYTSEDIGEGGMDILEEDQGEKSLSAEFFALVWL